MAGIGMTPVFCLPELNNADRVTSLADAIVS